MHDTTARHDGIGCVHFEASLPDSLKGQRSKAAGPQLSTLYPQLFPVSDTPASIYMYIYSILPIIRQTPYDIIDKNRKGGFTYYASNL